MKPSARFEDKNYRFAELKAIHSKFNEFMDDDFNTGGATAVLFELLTTLNKYADSLRLEDPDSKDEVAKQRFLEGAGLMREIGSILGLFYEKPQAATLGGDDKLVAGLMQLLIDLRNNLRAEAKLITDKTNPTKKALFDQTDLIRKRLGELGIHLEDRTGGTSWRVER